MGTGRPSKYNDETTCAEAESYLDEFELPKDERSTFTLRNAEAPSLIGLALHLKVANSTLDLWKISPGKESFSGICKTVMQVQHEILVGGGLSNRFNSQITKMMLTKHGYSDKQEIDNKSSDGSMTPKGFNDFYDKGETED